MEQFAPKLPIGTLDHALSVYKEWIRPLLTDEEFAQVEKITDSFGKNEGPKLAQKLQQYVDSLSDNKNWMAPFWTKMYLSIRDSLLTESNYALHLAPLKDKAAAENHAFMAHWISAVGHVYQQIKNHPQNIFEEGGHIFCDMNTRNLLGCARIPSEHEDKWVNYSEFLTNIAVFYKNQCFIMPIFDENQQSLSEEEIAAGLQAIQQEQGHSPCDFLSCSFQGSDTCVSFLKDFLSDAGNKAAFEELNKTIFHIVLTDEDFNNSLANQMDIIFTLPHIRWCYKPVTFLMWKNNEISAHMEHTGADGIIMMRILQLAKEQFQQKPIGKTAQSASKNYHALKWNYTHAQKAQLKAYADAYTKKVNEYSLKIYDFNASSANFAKTSRDALAQIVMQYGMNKISPMPQSIYSACAMGHFREGRTEALRTISLQSQAFVKDLEKTHQINQSLLDAALLEHKNRIKMCKQGHAPTRYLSGLAWISEGASASIEFFQNPLVARLGGNYFSTSNIGMLNDLCTLFLFSPPMPSRYGFGYLISQEAIRFCISYHKTDQEDLDKMIAGFDEFYQYTK